MYKFGEPNDGGISYGVYMNALGNSDLGWESTESWNAGFESAWLKERLFWDVDVYFSKTTDQLFERTIPVMSGFTSITTSLGQVNNSGVEMTLRSVNIHSNDLKWTTSVTFWKNYNKLVSLDGTDVNGDGKEDDDISNGLFIGKSLGAIYGYVQDGIVQEDDTEYMEKTGAAPGSFKYKDLDGVDGITSADRTILGYRKENFRLNMGNTVNYKNFELYVLLTGVFGGDNHYLTENRYAFQAGYGRHPDGNAQYIPYWTPENRSNLFPDPTVSDPKASNLQPRGFVRVQDVSLSYTFPQNWLNQAKINSLKIYFAAQNAAIFTKNEWTGGDPELGIIYPSNNKPVPSTYTIGFKLSF